MYKILIADDEPKVIQLIKALIDWDKLDIELVATVRDGITALQEIERLKPDIVITDIRMPGHDGIELIKKTRHMNMATDFIIISGYQHFDYAHTAIKYDVKDYLLKPLKKDEINDVLKKLIEKYNEEKNKLNQENEIIKQVKRDHILIRETFVNKLFSSPSQLVSLEEGQVFQDYHVKFDRMDYRVISIKPDISYFEGNHDLLKLLMSKTRTIAKKCLMPHVGESIFYDINGYVYCLINYDQEDYKKIRSGLIAIVNQVNALRDLFKNISVTIALSDTFKHLIDFEGYYQQVQYRIKDKILTSTSRIIDQSCLCSQEISQYLDKNQRTDFINIIRELNIKSFEDEAKKWANQISNLKDISGEMCYILANEIRELLIETLFRFDLIDDVSLSLTTLSETELHMEKSIYTLFERLIDYCKSLLKIALHKRKQNNAKPVVEAVKFIDENYMDSLSLELVSSKVGFNASYFSSLFKKETGKNFLEYLTLVRIEQAKRLLSDKSNKVGEIGMQCGYQDNKHFSKQFKKVTGLSPSQYKKLYF